MIRDSFFNASIGFCSSPVHTTYAVTAWMRIAGTPASAAQPEAAIRIRRNPFARIEAVARRFKQALQFFFPQCRWRDPTFAPRTGNGLRAIQIDDVNPVIL